MPKILMGTAACTRQMMGNPVNYDTVDVWIEMAKKVTRIDGFYLYLNDIPEPRRSYLFKLCKKEGIDYHYEDLGYVPDNRSRDAREIQEDYIVEKGKEKGKTKQRAVEGREYERFVVTRNVVIEYALKNNYDYIFNVDSDVICRPYTVDRILPRMKKNVGMVAVLINNLARYLSKSRVTIFKVPEPQFKWNICDYVETPGKHPFIRHTKIRRNTVMDVHISGGCCLLNLEPFRTHGIRYECDWNGEDANICLKLRKLGYKIIVDTADDLETLHLQELWVYKNKELIDSYLHGERPDYFRFKVNL